MGHDASRDDLGPATGALPNTRRRWLPPVVLAASVLASVLPGRGQTVAMPLPGEHVVVGALIQDREVGWLEVRRDANGYLLPLLELADLIGCRVEIAEDVTTVVTPFGSRSLPANEITEEDGVLYVHELWIEESLASGVEFDASRYALSFDLPWRPGAGRVERRSTPALEAE
ncbi:MAG: hypothetical protein R3344_11050, partial [Acidobacteriota bacterium]|nr:hypothetical protein [Acidobacteriota bacterium]